MSVDFDELERDLTEKEMALFIGATMAMFSAIEAGADPANLIARLKQHEQNFATRGQESACHIMAAFQMMAGSAQRR